MSKTVEQIQCDIDDLRVKAECAMQAATKAEQYACLTVAYAGDCLTLAARLTENVKRLIGN